MRPINVTNFSTQQSERVLELNDNLQRAMVISRQAQKAEDELRNAWEQATRVTHYAEVEARHAQAVLTSYLASL